ncbi:aspartate/glutamate racemase family protein [Mesorhizobium sp. SP-1A]|uniref:aspartate/glutamate racemase family protein n=1 Tax=Mesorhizobium sp. SP-1A TaxID=3077840 RepID=UPI0028F6F87E|nr:aspartate/glutamate racemase family protein [Mesorhizobium sp. SP-1A]
MRILLINPNTSTFVTEKVAAEARRIAAPGTEIVAVTGRCGPAIVSGRAEDALAAAEAMSLAAEYGGDCDAVVLAISFDSGLRALREMLTIPVVGMSEAAMLAACTLGSRFAMVTFGNRAVPIYAEICQSYGLGGRLSNVVSLAPLSDAEMRDPLLILPRLAEAIDETVSRDGTEAAILAGAIFAGITHAVAEKVSIPVLNGVAEAVGIAEMLVRTAPRKAGSGSYQLPAAKKIEWPNPALVSHFARF